MNCNKCGYKNKAGSKTCEKCKASLASVSNPFELIQEEDKTTYYNCSQCAYLLPDSKKVCTKCGYNHIQKMEERKKTIPFASFQYKATTSGMKLTPLNFEGEPISRKGETNMLSRDDIDSQDMTISSQNHVEFKKMDGKWYIENGSSNNAVFLQVTRNTVIESGSIIILGQSKVFKFEEM